MSIFTGGKWLLCWPDDYDVRYKINPWMDTRRTPNRSRATKQWIELHHTLLRLGAWVEYIDQGQGLPDMVFTANGGLVVGQKVILPKFRYKERQGEEPLFRAWFENNGFSCIELSSGSFEGEGDALFLGEALIGAYGFRSDRPVYAEMAAKVGIHEVIEVELLDSRFYHLDTCFCPLSEKLAFMYEPALSADGVAKIRSKVEVLTVPEHDAIKFVCNSVVLDKKIVMPAGCPDTQAVLESRGFEVYPVELDEFIKAGGAAKCLSLKISGV